MYQLTLTPTIDTEKFVISLLDIDTIIILTKVNKTIYNIVNKIPIYIQLLSYIKNSNKFDVFEYICMNNYFELMIRLDKYGYKFMNMMKSIRMTKNEKIQEWWTRSFRNSCAYSKAKSTLDLTLVDKCLCHELQHNDHGYSFNFNNACGYSSLYHSRNKFKILNYADVYNRNICFSRLYNSKVLSQIDKLNRNIF